MRGVEPGPGRVHELPVVAEVDRDGRVRDVAVEVDPEVELDQVAGGEDPLVPLGGRVVRGRLVERAVEREREPGVGLEHHLLDRLDRLEERCAGPDQRGAGVQDAVRDPTGLAVSLEDLVVHSTSSSGNRVKFSNPSDVTRPRSSSRTPPTSGR